MYTFGHAFLLTNRVSYVCQFVAKSAVLLMLTVSWYSQGVTLVSNVSIAVKDKRLKVQFCDRNSRLYISYSLQSLSDASVYSSVHSFVSTHPPSFPVFSLSFHHPSSPPAWVSSKNNCCQGFEFIVLDNSILSCCISP